MSEPCTTETDVYEQRLLVALKYDVFFTHFMLSGDNPILADVLGSRECRDVLVFLDSGLVDAWPGLASSFERYLSHHGIDLKAPPFVVPGGEQVKDGWEHAGQAVEDIRRNRLCRHSVVVAAGGGAVLDAVGFAASLVHRGVRLVRIPTTTLSQGDSAVGVKNGINLRSVKNLVGVFAPPFAVINDFDFLRTLAPELVLDGIAEAFKVAIIKDAAFFQDLMNAGAALARGDAPEVHDAVRRSAMLHLDHISRGGDPFELGNARPLDFGHWSAHWLEGASSYTVRHGQAVAVGIALDSYLAAELGHISGVERDLIVRGLEGSGLPTWHPLLASRGPDGTLRVLAGLDEFREHLGGTLSITLPRGIGQRIEVRTVPEQVIAAGVELLGRRAAA
jgi:3-dehydroquinate synthase